MPGKVNPVIMRGRAAGRRSGRRQRRRRSRSPRRTPRSQLTTAMPVMAAQPAGEHRAVRHARLTLLAEKGMALLEVNASRMRELRDAVTIAGHRTGALIGYDRAAVIAKSMVEHGSTIEQAGRRELGDEAWERARRRRRHRSGWRTPTRPVGPQRSGAERSVVVVVACFQRRSVCASQSGAASTCSLLMFTVTRIARVVDARDQLRQGSGASDRRSRSRCRPRGVRRRRRHWRCRSCRSGRRSPRPSSRPHCCRPARRGGTSTLRPGCIVISTPPQCRRTVPVRSPRRFRRRPVCETHRGVRPRRLRTQADRVPHATWPSQITPHRPTTPR